MLQRNCFDYVEKVTYSQGCKICTREDFERMLDDGNVKRNCESVAAIRDKETPDMTDEERKNLKETANLIKKENKAIVFHGHSETGQRKNECMTPSPWCCMDIDNVDDPRDCFERMRPALEGMNCPLAFISPSNRGLKFLMPMVEGMDRKEAQKYFADVLHLPSYDSTPDLARCCFMVPRANLLLYKPDELFAPEVELLPNPSCPGAVVPYEEIEPVIEDAEIIEDNIEEPTAKTDPNAEITYHSIPLSRIISTYWIVNNGGNTPVNGERNDLTYELALSVRHICDYNREVMLRVIPQYDGLPDAERIACIDSALKRPRSKMPEKMLKTLNFLRKEERDNLEFQQSLLDIEEDYNCYHINQIITAFAQPSAHVKGMPRSEYRLLPAGLRETLESLPDNVAMVVIVAVGPMIGVLATNVRLRIRDEEPKALCLQSYVIGNSGSGKSRIDKVDELWMKTWRAKQAIEIEKERVYEEQRRAKRNAKDQPKDPKAKILELSARTSTSMVLIRLENADGAMCYTYVQEVDMGTANGGQTFNKDLGVISRQAFDESKYDTSYMNTDTGTRNIPHVRWNTLKCGTPDALYRAQKGYLNGEIQRLAIGSMPDNTFAPFKSMKPRSQKSIDHIIAYSSLIQLMQGEVRLPLLEQAGLDWLERVRLESLREDDEVKAGLRMRIPIIAERICCGLMLAQFARWLMAQLDERKGELPKWAGGCKTAEQYLLTHPDAIPEHLPKFQNVAWYTMMSCLCDYLHEQILFYFRSRITRSRASDDYVEPRSYRTANDSIFDQLPMEFDDSDLIKCKNGNKEAARSLRRRWIKHGLIKLGESQGHYVKCS
ncbi:MAG: hypothetical protein IKX59_09375 [Bacteroidales bacterium]|nr:hypothetical protein [Bacteroidales bacterium]